MKMNKDMDILIVGLGLLGGSYSKALKRRGFSVRALTKDQDSIDYAIKQGWIDKGTIDPLKAELNKADLVIFALYPHVFLEWIDNYQQLLKPGAVLTDVTGVKGGVVRNIQSKLREDVEYIAAHPMAGKEVYGVQNSDDRMFYEANYIVVPTDKNTKEAIELCCDLGRELGFARIAELSVEEHDEMIAFLSQLTHCIAVSLMCTNDDEKLVSYTGDSFRDLTRIAKINDVMWSELFLMNKDALLRQMDLFSEQFAKLRDSLENGDTKTMRQMMRCSTERRRKFDENGRIM